jgi:hypothetical protein
MHYLFTVVFVRLILALASCRQSDEPTSGDRPTFRYVKEKEGGCGNLFLHKGTADDLEVLWISADKNRLRLPAKGSATFDLAAAPEGLQVTVDVWEKAPRFRAYCNDISPNTRKKATWKARKGRLVITIGEPVNGANGGAKTYKASARLEGVVFDDGAGHQETLPEETITEALIGWLAG